MLAFYNFARSTLSIAELSSLTASLNLTYIPELAIVQIVKNLKICFPEILRTCFFFKQIQNKTSF